MSAMIAGPYLAAAGLLVVAGAEKAWRPDGTGRALAAAGLPVPGWLVRGGGVVEAGLGLSAMVVGGRGLAAAVALSYAVFAGFVVTALVRHTPLSTCGCFGQVDTPPTGAHVAINLAAVAVAAVVATGRSVTVARALRGEPLWGAPWLLATATVGFLVFLVMTTSARLLAVRRSVGVRRP